MRQVLIKQNANIVILDHNRCCILSEGPLNFEPGLNIVKLKFPVEVVAGGDLKFMFKISAELSRVGLLLAGSEFDGSEVEAIIYNLGTTTIIRLNPVAILYASAYETLKVMAVEGMPAGVSLFGANGQKYEPAGTDQLNAKKPVNVKKPAKKKKQGN
jgi:hypothetical protein